MTDSATARVEVDTGTLRGRRAGDACAFRGIPYAAPTGGCNRFLAPQPPAPWTGVRDALAHGDRCPQEVGSIGSHAVLAWYAQHGSFSEDCCSLNVFTPGLQRDAQRAVIVYVHGGGYASGSSNGPALDGSALAAFGDVVVVTVNHRLNLFGYTHLGHLDAQGFGDAANAGQLDLIAALHWVQRNIGAFGGDPGNVTLMGQSGGGNKIMTLLTMPAARGLFRRAVNMGGATGVRVLGPRQVTSYVDAMLRELAVSPRDLRQLRETSRQLMSALVAFARHGTPGNPLLPAWPAYEASRRATMVVDAQCRLVHDFHGGGRIASDPLRSDVPPTTLTRGSLFRHPA